MIPSELKDILSHKPDVMSGAICFSGTRVPVQALLDTLEDGDNVQEFLTGFPDVSVEQAQAVVRWEQTQARRLLELDSVS